MLSFISNNKFISMFLLYYILISLASVILTVVDKRRAIKNKWRVPEATLLLFAALGGALPMLLCMRIIRHKTLRRKFMFGLPLIIAVHVVIILLLTML